MRELTEQEKREKCFTIFDKALKNNSDNAPDTAVDSDTNNVECLFDYCISNPPYQMDASTDVNNSANNIFHLFYDYGYTMSNHLVMIFPGGRWMQRSTKGRKAANLIYPTVKSIEWYPNDRKNRSIFETVIIPDGLSIVAASNSATISKSITVNDVLVNRPQGDDILPLTRVGGSIISKIQDQYDSFVIRNKKPRMFFGLPSYYVSRNPDLVNKLQEEGTIKAFLANDGKGSAKRVETYYISNSILEGNEEFMDYFSSFKVCISQANAAKLPGTSPYFTVEKESIVGETWFIVGKFDTREEADNYASYLMSKTCKYLLEESKGGKLKTWGYFVPDLGDYTSNNPDIDWSQVQVLLEAL